MEAKVGAKALGPVVCTLACWMGPRASEAGGGPAESSESSGGVGGRRKLTTRGNSGF